MRLQGRHKKGRKKKRALKDSSKSKNKLRLVVSSRNSVLQLKKKPILKHKSVQRKLINCALKRTQLLQRKLLYGQRGRLNLMPRRLRSKPKKRQKQLKLHAWPRKRPKRRTRSLQYRLLDHSLNLMINQHRCYPLQALLQPQKTSTPLILRPMLKPSESRAKRRLKIEKQQPSRPSKSRRRLRLLLPRPNEIAMLQKPLALLKRKPTKRSARLKRRYRSKNASSWSSLPPLKGHGWHSKPMTMTANRSQMSRPLKYRSLLNQPSSY